MSNFLLKITSFFSKKKDRNKILSLLREMDGSEKEIHIVTAALKLKEIKARDLMIPRIDIQAINLSQFDESSNSILDNGSYSRIPIYEEDVDNIKGILHTKDYYLALIHKKKGKVNIKTLLSDPYFVPESKSVLSILQEFQQKHLHMAVVIDEYSGVSGIITLEDIIEEIIGDVQDEFDEELKEILQIEPHIFSIDARISIEELKETIPSIPNNQEVDTLGGLLILEVGYIPKLNQTITIGETQFKVTKKRRNSLLRIKISLPINS